MKKLCLTLLAASCFCLAGCNDEQAKQELEKLRVEVHQKTERLAKVEAELAEAKKLIQLTIEAPQKRYEEIQALMKSEQFEQVQPLLSMYLNEFPTSRHAITVKNIQKELPRKIAAAKKAAEEKLKALQQGFSKLPVKASFECSNAVKISGRNFKAGKTFAFDREGDRYYYQTADKNSIYISGDISVTSKDSNPMLPAIMVGKVTSEGRLEDVRLMGWRLYRWESYASYLGNEGDNGNDFSKNDTVRFSIGVQMPKEKGIYVVFTAGDPYFVRNYERFDRPPVSYKMDHTQPFPIPMQGVSLEEFLERYTALAIIKR